MSKIYRISEFARRIGRSPSTVRRWEAEGKLHPKRLASGGSVYFFVSGRNLSVGRSDSPPSFWRPVTPQKEGLSSPPRRQAIERVGKHSWNSAGPKGVARGASICREMVLARPERLLTACGVRGMKAEHRPPILPSHAAASAGVTGAAPLSRRRSIGRRW